MTLGKRLKRARKHAKITQEELVNRSGILQGTISKIERGDQNTCTSVARLARATGVDAFWLETGEGEMSAKILYQHNSPIINRILSRLEGMSTVELEASDQAFAAIEKAVGTTSQPNKILAK